jgi:hypothetical protein
MTDTIISFLWMNAAAAMFYIGLPIILAGAIGGLASRLIDDRGQLLVIKSAIFLIALAAPMWITYQATSMGDRSNSLTPTPASAAEFLNAFIPKAIVLTAVYAVIGFYRMRPSGWFSGTFWFFMQVILLYTLILVWH